MAKPPSDLLPAEARSAVIGDFQLPYGAITLSKAEGISAEDDMG